VYSRGISDIERVRQVVLIIFSLLVLVLVGGALKLYRDMGGFRELELLPLENCRPVLGVLSSEDITIDPATGFAFISGADRRGFRGERLPGAIFGYALQRRPMQPENLTAELEMEFQPHGLGLYRGSNAKKLLFAVNHRQDRDTVEIFRVRGTELIHDKSIEGDLLRYANDIVAVGEDLFYVTRDHGYNSDWGKRLEEYLQLKASSVIYYDGEQFRVVAEGLAYANGVNVSPDGLLLYVASTLQECIRVYSRNPEDGALTFRDEIPLGSAVDNIEVDEEGDLWIGAHPKPLDFVQYSKDPRALSPSQVLKLSFNGNGNYEVEQIHISDGRYLSGSSVAARWRQYLLIGSVFDRRFLVCQLDEDQPEAAAPEEMATDADSKSRQLYSAD
jgi:arylesterase/paraoxonase